MTAADWRSAEIARGLDRRGAVLNTTVIGRITVPVPIPVIGGIAVAVAVIEPEAVVEAKSTEPETISEPTAAEAVPITTEPAASALTTVHPGHLMAAGVVHATAEPTAHTTATDPGAAHAAATKPAAAHTAAAEPAAAHVAATKPATAHVAAAAEAATAAMTAASTAAAVTAAAERRSIPGKGERSAERQCDARNAYRFHVELHKKSRGLMARRAHPLPFVASGTSR